MVEWAKEVLSKHGYFRMFCKKLNITGMVKTRQTDSGYLFQNGTLVCMGIKPLASLCIVV